MIATTLIKSFVSPTYEKNANNDPIFQVQQFFISANPERNNELRECLRRNVEIFDKIFLLNERFYTEEELGVSSPKIEQFIIGHRLKVGDIFWFSKLRDLKGYIVFGNSDIFFDATLLSIRKTDLHAKAAIFCQLRFEYEPGSKEQQINSSVVNGFLVPNFIAQDTWILHSNFVPKLDIDHYFGLLGIDHVILRKFVNLGYVIYNEPFKIKTFHYHSSKFRTYSEETRIHEPYIGIHPHFPKNNPFAEHCESLMQKFLQATNPTKQQSVDLQSSKTINL
jgi:hypothetical protein